MFNHYRKIQARTTYSLIPRLDLKRDLVVQWEEQGCPLSLHLHYQRAVCEGCWEAGTSHEGTAVVTGTWGEGSGLRYWFKNSRFRFLFSLWTSNELILYPSLVVWFCDFTLLLERNFGDLAFTLERSLVTLTDLLGCPSGKGGRAHTMILSWPLRWVMSWSWARCATRVPLTWGDTVREGRWRQNKPGWRE